MGPTKARRVLGAVVAGVALTGVLVAPAAASGRTQIQTQDRCDPATFNAVLGAGVCVPTRRGDVTFEEFGDKLNPDDGGHGAWRNSREETHIDHGDMLHIRNTGGEGHTFTEVEAFGAGEIPPLNEALPDGNDTPLAEPIGDPHFLDPGGVAPIAGLGPGVHYFQCLIHPWMRTVVDVR